MLSVPHVSTAEYQIEKKVPQNLNKTKLSFTPIFLHKNVNYVTKTVIMKSVNFDRYTNSVILLVSMIKREGKRFDKV